MQLKHLKTNVLLENTKAIAEKDRKNLIELLHHLKEVEARRAYLGLGYADLKRYICFELKYSEGSAGRRIIAMHLLKDVPEVEEKLE